MSNDTHRSKFKSSISSMSLSIVFIKRESQHRLLWFLCYHRSCYLIQSLRAWHNPWLSQQLNKQMSYCPCVWSWLFPSTVVMIMVQTFPLLFFFFTLNIHYGNFYPSLRIDSDTSSYVIGTNECFCCCSVDF